MASRSGSTTWKIINHWVEQLAAVEVASAPVALTASQMAMPIKIEYYENTGDASIRLSWSSSSTPKQLVPQCQLYSAGDTTRRTAISATDQHLQLPFGAQHHRHRQRQQRHRRGLGHLAPLARFSSS